MYDVSLAWFPWLGAAASLELLVQWRAAGELEDPLRLAQDLAAGLGLPWGGATLVCLPVEDLDRAREALAGGGIRGSLRATGIRLSTHVYNDDADIARAIDALAPVVAL